ncbi:hypothetical protein [Kushneria marisflavi]|uniref:hypothetical protein n=1 Tax=Kushneria marisflavi TaxID=157779 RepID=UPI000FF37099|nr:hypothetical protein [Kushneria marisflavi]RKD87599.1 hypothetical protein C8D96_1083 [Kushneria marisflavi]
MKRQGMSLTGRHNRRKGRCTALMGAALVAAMGLCGAANAAPSYDQGGVVTLTPRVRFLPLEAQRDPVDVSARAQSLMNYRVIEAGTPMPQAYVVSGSEGRLISGAGDQIVARYVQGRSGQRFGLYTPGILLKDDQGEVLGQVMIRQGVARLERSGTPLSTLTVEKSPREVSAGTRLMVLDDWTPPRQLVPSMAPAGTRGQILDRPGAGRIVGLRDIVVIDLGRHQVMPGMRLRVQGEPEEVTDPVTGESLVLDGGVLGELMIVRTFEQTSLALVTRAELPMATGDRVETTLDD